MLHADWFLVASTFSTAQPESTGSAPATTGGGGNVNVVGLPTGAQPPAGAAPAPGATTGTPGTVPPAAPRSADLTFFWMMGGVMLLFVLINVFAGRGERKRRAKMLSAMGKGDRVMMSGGMIGTISEISDSEVVVRVEEGKVRFARSSVQSVLESRNNSAA